MTGTRQAGTNFSNSAVYVSQDAEDAAHVQRCLDGEAAAFTPIVERYQRLLYTVALRMLGDPEDANDATQNAFVKAYQKLRTFDQTRRFFSWIYRILVNECHNARRERRATEPITPEMAIGDSPADLLEADERRRRVQAAILALPLASREVIILRHFAEMSYEQIADALAITPAVVKSRLHTARARLCQMLLNRAEP